jgi:hypothetical protein
MVLQESKLFRYYNGVWFRVIEFIRAIYNITRKLLYSDKRKINNEWFTTIKR